MKQLCASIIILLAIAPGCVTTTPGQEEAEEEKTPLQVAQGHISAREYPQARAALEKHLDDEPDDVQARYMYAKTLGYLGELRGAKKELRQVLEEAPDNPLAWDLLGAVHEQLGEHAQALEAYYEVQKRADSLSPVLGIARCQLYLGQPEAALTTLEALRTNKVQSPWTEFFTYQALRRMGRNDDAEEAARAYLDLAKDQEEHDDYVPPVRRWLEAHRFNLQAPVRQAMVDYVRAACRLRLPQAEPPEEKVLRAAPDRLFVFDDRPVFVTLYTPERRFVGRGRGKTLASALKGALQAVKADPHYAPVKLRNAALRIDVGRDLEPVELRSNGERLVTKPHFERGHHGIALRADGQEVVALPGDVISEDLHDLRALLSHACQRAGLGRDAWRTSTSAMFRFEAESFLSSAPGVSPADLQGSELTPLPEPTLRNVQLALERGGRWLLSQVLPEGALAKGYSPIHDRFDTRGGDQVMPAKRSDTLRAALAFARLSEGNQAFRGACQHLVNAQAKQRDRFDPQSLNDLRAVVAATPKTFPELAKELEGSPAPEAKADLAWARKQLSTPPPVDPLARARWLARVASGAAEALRTNEPDASALRDAVLKGAGSLLALQLGPRHGYLCKEPGQALGGFRKDLGTSHLDAAMAVEAVLALIEVAELLGAQ